MANKKQVIAVTVIHRTIEPGKAGDKVKGISPQKPKIKAIEPGAIFMADDETALSSGKTEFGELMDAGAIRVPDSGEKVPVKLDRAFVGDDDDDDAEPAKKTTSRRKSRAAKPKPPQGGATGGGLV